jgi:hypothetical protein
MEKEKKPEFVVTDRRKFNVDGERRDGAPAEQAAAAPSPITPPEPVKDTPSPESVADHYEPASTPGPIIDTGYNAETQRVAFGGQKMEFVHLLDMLGQTAMMYSGAMDEGTERRVDIIGMRQMIDLISVLEEKTRGNLTEQEQAILTNTVFQLRMAYMEIVNMIDRQAMQKAPGAPGAPRK